MIINLQFLVLPFPFPGKGEGLETELKIDQAHLMKLLFLKIPEV
jgi:hypothetical protein